MITNRYQKLKAARRQIGLKNTFGRIIIFFVTSVIPPIIPHSIPHHYLFPTLGYYQKEIRSRKCQTIISYSTLFLLFQYFFMAVISGYITDLILPVADSSGSLVVFLSLLLKLIIFTLLCFILSNPLINLRRSIDFISGVNRYQSLTSILKVIKQSTGESLFSFKNLFFHSHMEQYSWYNEHENHKKLHESLRKLALKETEVRPVVKQGKRYEQLLERYEYVIPDFFGKDTKIDPEEKYIKSIVKCVYSDERNYLVSGDIDTSLTKIASLASVGTHITRMFSGVGPDIIIMFPVDEHFDEKFKVLKPRSTIHMLFRPKSLC